MRFWEGIDVMAKCRTVGFRDAKKETTTRPGFFYFPWWKRQLAHI
jgi:hypothetical protein